MKIMKAKRQIRVKQSETNRVVKTKNVGVKWIGLCYSHCFHPKFFLFWVQPKLAVSLFRETTETNLFVSNSLETSFISSYSCFDINQVS